MLQIESFMQQMLQQDCTIHRLITWHRVLQVRIVASHQVPVINQGLSAFNHTLCMYIGYIGVQRCHCQDSGQQL
jgi:hypothetical protein